MHALILICINQYTKFEVPSITNYKAYIGAKFKKMGHVTLTMPLFGVVCYLKLGFGTAHLHAKMMIVALAVPEISLGYQNLKWVT